MSTRQRLDGRGACRAARGLAFLDAQRRRSRLADETCLFPIHRPSLRADLGETLSGAFRPSRTGDDASGETR